MEVFRNTQQTHTDSLVQKRENTHTHIFSMFNEIFPSLYNKHTVCQHTRYRCQKTESTHTCETHSSETEKHFQHLQKTRLGINMKKEHCETHTHTHTHTPMVNVTVNLMLKTHTKKSMQSN